MQFNVLMRLQKNLRRNAAWGEANRGQILLTHHNRSEIF